MYSHTSTWLTMTEEGRMFRCLFASSGPVHRVKWYGCSTLAIPCWHGLLNVERL